MTLYLAGVRAEANDLFAADVSPKAWWQAGLRLGFSASLADLDVQLHSTVASSAGSGRRFSTLRIAYGMLHMRLDIEKEEKLGLLYRVYGKGD